MNKIEFLNELYYYLGSLPHNEKNEILDDFREHFREGEAAGKSEEQICNELGTPFECARQYVGDEVMQAHLNKNQKKKPNKTFWTVALFWNIIQAFISIPMTFGAFLLAAVMIVAFCFIVPAVSSTALLVFAISSTLTVLCFGVITLLWTIIEIKECIERINK